MRGGGGGGEVKRSGSPEEFPNLIVGPGPPSDILAVHSEMQPAA